MGTRKSMLMGMLAVVLTLLTPMVMAQEFKAVAVDNYDNVSVMEVTGNYDTPTTTDPANAIPRQMIAKEFYRTHKDDYDFLVIFSNFDFQMPITVIDGQPFTAQGFYQPIKNDVAGIGKQIFDNSALFGSQGKLQGTIDMGFVDKKVMDPLDPNFQDTMMVLSHELLHRWSAYVKFKKWDESISKDLLGPAEAHWSFLLDTKGSMQYGNPWIDNGDGTFTSLPGGKYYSPLDLYLMGLIPKDQVPPIFLIENPEINKERLPEPGLTINGTRHTVSVDDIIAAEGERTPNAALCQKNFKIGCIYITRPGTFEGRDEVYQLRNVLKNWIIWFSSLTKGKAMVKIDAAPEETIPINPGVTPPPYDPRTAPASIQDGLAWLLNSQKQDGSWQDSLQTLERETAETIFTLGHFPETQANVSAGIDWLSGTTELNTDYLSRKIEIFIRANLATTTLLGQLLAKQNADGGWGSAGIYGSNAADTAMALRALWAADIQTESVVRPAINFLKNEQHADGGWGQGDQDGTIQATVNVLQVLTHYQEKFPLSEVIQKGLAWLFGKQNPDGGFGNSPSTVYDTALTLALLKNFQVSTDMTDKALGYILSFQDANGGWYASPYQTALAVNALYLWNDAVSIDLAVDAEKIVFTPTAADNPPQMIAVQAEIRNLGLIAVAGVKVAFYDGAINEANKKGEQMIDVPARTARVLNFELEIIDDKAHEIFVVVDPENIVKEVKEDNNSASGTIENRTCLKPDLAINADDISFAPENIITIPQNITIQVKVNNKGRVDANNSVIALYDGEISPAKKVGEKTISVAAGASAAVLFSSTTQDGNRHIFLAVADPDNLQDECIENNNIGVKTLYPKMTYDFQAVSVDVSPPTVDMSGIVAITARITNNGTSDAYMVPVRYYIDQAGSPYEIAYLNLDISAGQTIEKQITWQADVAGENLPMTVQVDPSNIYNELSETNNKAVTPVTIKQFTQSNLSIDYSDIIITPAPALEAGNANISALVKNQGFSEAANIVVEFYHGLTKTDMQLLGTQTISSLGPGQTSNAGVNWEHIPFAGKQYITVLVDPQNSIPEISEEDNSAFTTLDIQSLPDLAIATNSIAFHPEAPKEDEAVTILVTVQNFGDQEAVNMVVQLKESGQIIASDSIAKIAGHSQGAIDFQYLTQGKPGGHRIDVTIDPQNLILEKSKENNTASRSFGVQNADLWVSEPIFSPNGDSIKDNTQFFFRLKQSQAVQVVVVNAKNRVVRTYRGDEFANTTGNAVTWDGLDENGRLVPDSQYQFQVRNTSGTVLSMLPVIVDTDRSSLIEAIGTPYLFKSIVGSGNMTWSQWFPDESGLVFLISLTDANAPGYTAGIYTTSVDGEDILRIVPLDWSNYNGADNQYYYDQVTISPDSQKIAFSLMLWNKIQKTVKYQIWTVDRYGENLVLLLTATSEQFRNLTWSPDSNYLLYSTFDGKHGFIKADGTGKIEMAPSECYSRPKWALTSDKLWAISPTKKIIQIDLNGNSNEVFSPDTDDYVSDFQQINKDQLLVSTDMGLWIVDTTGNGQSNKIFDYFRDFWWANNQLFAYDGLGLWLVDTTGNGNHKFLVKVDLQYRPMTEYNNKNVVVSPDGQAIAYMEAVKSTDPAKYYMRVGICETQNKCEIVYTAQPPRYGYGGWFDFGGLTWSRDGQKLAFIDDMYEKDKTPDGEDVYYSNAIITDKATSDKKTIRISKSDESVWGDAYLGSLQWFFDDESLLGEDDQTLYAILSENGKKIPFPVKKEYLGDHLYPHLSPHGRYLIYGEDGESIIGSLLNLTADLKVAKNKNSITLRGTAADLHFESYTLQYADINDPNNWKIILPPSDQMVVSHDFMEWVPPYQGIFLVRLIVQDKAGNTALDRKRVSWGQFTVIADLKQSDTIFSPNYDGVKDTLEISYRIITPVHLQFFIYNAEGLLIRTISKSYAEPQQDSLVWDGRNDVGAIVPDGNYKIQVLDYEFPVEVDTTLPEGAIKLEPNIELKGDADSDPCGSPNISSTLFALAMDKNLKKWLIEYGEGDNPQDWYELQQGDGAFYSSDSNDGIGHKAVTVFENELFHFPVNKRFRITVSDTAGNEITINTINSWQKALLMTQWDGNKIKYDRFLYGTTGQFESCDVADKKTGQHQIQGVDSILRPIERLTLQYHRNDQWINGAEIMNPPVGVIDLIWDNTAIPIGELEFIDKARLRAIDIDQNEYFSPPIMFVSPQFRLFIGYLECDLRTINGLGAKVFLLEDLLSLQVQVRSDSDVRYKEWTDFFTKDVNKGDEVPAGIFEISMPPDLKPEVEYFFRMIGKGLSGKDYSAEGEKIQKGSRIKIKSIRDTIACDTLVNKLDISYGIEANKILMSCFAGKRDDLQKLTYYLENDEGIKLFHEYDLHSIKWEDLVSKALNQLANDSKGLIPITHDSFDISFLPENGFKFIAIFNYMEYDHGKETLKKETDDCNIVDHQLPQAQFTNPNNGEEVCTRQIQKVVSPGTWEGIDLKGVIADDISGEGKYVVYYSLAAEPTKWLLAYTYGISEITGLLVHGPIEGIIPKNGLIGTWDVSNIPKDTPVNLKLVVIDKAWNIKCDFVSFQIASVPQVKLSCKNHVFSPNGDGLFDNVTINYSFDRDVSANIKVFSNSQSGLVKTLLLDQVHKSGDYSIEWDGTDDSGRIVADGVYQVNMSVPDPCTGERRIYTTMVEVDNTPPSIDITYPGPTAIPCLIIEAKGTVNDPHFKEYKLIVPEINIQIGADEKPKINEILGRWNRYGLNGRYTFKLTAEDQVGNKSEKVVEVQLDAIVDFIKKLEVSPPIFSPNNDGKLEKTLVQYELTDNMAEGFYITLEILNGQNPIRTYQSGVPLFGGLHTWEWDGKDSNGTWMKDGIYTVVLTAKYAKDTNLSQQEQISVEVDITPPFIDITQPEDESYIKSNAVSVQGTLTDKNMEYYDLNLKGNTQNLPLESGNQNRINYTFAKLDALEDGPYTLSAKARDAAQNVNEKTISFTMDRIPPKVTLSAPQESELFGNKKQIIEIKGAIEEKNPKEWALRYGAGENPKQWTDLISGTTNLPSKEDLYNWQVDSQSGVKDSLYTIQLYVKDKAGWESETSVKVSVDNTPPLVSIDFPANGGYVTKAFDIKGTSFDENLAEYTLEISEGACSAAYKWILLKKDTQNVKDELITVFEALPPDGQYCLRLKAIDRVGYKSEAKVGIIVDTTPPAALVLSGQVQDRSNALLTWTANVEPDLAGYNLYRDNQKLNQELIKQTQFLDKNLEEGIFQYIVKAVDKAGWESDPSNIVSLKIDLTPPPNAHILSPQDKAKVNDIVTIKGTAYSEEDFKEYRLYVGQGAAPSTWQLLIRSPVPMTYGKLADWDTIALPEDQYFIKLEAEDLSGNTNTHQIMVQIDNTPPGPPVLTKAEQQQIPLESNVDLAWEANSGPEPVPDIIGYLLYCNHELANVNMNVIGDLKPYLINAKTYKDMDLPDGKFTYYVMAMDDAGNISEQSNSLDVNIDMHAPKVVITVPNDGHRFESTILVKGETPDLDIAQVQFQYQKPGETTWNNLNSPVVNLPYTTYLDPVALNLIYGAYRLQAVATDLGGRADLNPTAIVVYYTDTTAPAAPLNLKSLADEGRAILTWDANSEQDLKGYNIYLVQETSKTKLNTDLVSGATTFIHGGYDDEALADGEYTYEITALDTYGNESKPSDPSKALIYTPLLEQPYTPSGVSPIQVAGDQAKPNDSVEVYISVDEEPGTLQSKVLADDKGQFTFITALPFDPTWLCVQAADEQGNRSKKSLPVIVLYNEPPATPTGLQGTAEEHTVHLTWNPNSEPDLAGYFLYRDNQKINQAVAINSGTASASYSSNFAQRAFDQNVSTYWYCYVYKDSPQWWQIDLPAPELIQQLELDFVDSYSAPLDYDVQVWTGYAWLTLQKIEGNHNLQNILEIKPAYKTQKIRIVLKHAVEGYIALAEVYLLKANPVAVLPQPGFDDPERPDGKYHYQVSAVDQYGLESPLSTEIEVLVGDFTPPTKPINLTAVPDHADVILSWTPNSEPDLAGYYVYRKNAQGWSRIESDLTDSTYTDFSLANGTYTYRVTAIDTSGNESEPSNEASAAIQIELPQQPINLQITTVPEGRSLKICWDAPDGPIAGFNLYRVSAPGGPYVKVNAYVIEESTCYLDEGLDNGTRYFYYVAAVDAFGNESQHSNEENAIPNDVVAPLAIIVFPTVSGQLVQSSETKTDIVGFSEPGALIELFKEDRFISRSIAYQDHQTQATPLPGDAGQPTLSPDGKSLAYIRYDDATDEDYIWIMDIATGKAAKMAAGGSLLAWSPDSRKFIYGDYQNGYRCLSVYDRGTGLSIRLTDNNQASEFDPTWSPDNGRIVFVVYKNGSESIWIKDMATGSLTKLTGLSAYQQAYGPKFAPDSSGLAYLQTDWTTGENSLIIASLGPDTLFSVVTSTAGNSFDWAPGGKRIAYIAYENDKKNIHVFDIESGQKIQITDAATSGQSIDKVFWSPYEHFISYLAYDEFWSSLWGSCVKEFSRPVLLKRFRENRFVFHSWRPTGEIAHTEHAQDGYEFRQGYPDGCFLFPNTILDVGINNFSAQATDAAGNIGPRSDEISVILSADSLPDLETTAQAIIIYPASPMKEQTVSINAIIKNKGGAKAENFNADLYLADTPGNVFLLNSFLIPVLESGSEKTVHVSWTSGNQTGVYTIMVVLDAAEKVAEISEQNNFAFRDFYIAAEEGVALNTNLNGQGYEAFSDLNIQTVISNSGAARDLVLEMQIEDEFGTPVYAFAPLAANMTYGAVKETQWTWNTGSIYAGNYQVHAVLKENGNTIQQNMVPFQIMPELDVSIELSIDKLHYGTLEDVLLDIPIINRGRNFDIPHLEVKTSILLDDISVFSRTFSLDNLPADSNINLAAVWNTGFSPAATYQANVELFIDSRLTASSSSEFVIDPVTKLGGTLQAVPETVYFSRPVRADFTIGNKGNTSGTTVLIRVLLLDPDTQNVLNNVEKTVSLDQNGNGSGQCIFPTTGYGLKTYKLLLQSAAQDVSQTLATATFTIKDGVPPIVSILSPIDQSRQSGPFDLLVQAADDVSGINKVEYRPDAEIGWRLLPPVDPATSKYGTRWIPIEADEGPHTIRFRASDRAGNVSEPIATSIRIVPRVDMTMNLNAEQYGLNEDATIKVDLANIAWAKGVTLKVNILNNEGVVLHGFDPVQAALAADESREFAFTWNTGLNPAGLYKAQAVLTKADLNLGEITEAFSILPILKFSSGLTTDKIHYGLKENTAINLSVTNNGNAVAPLLNLKLKIRPEGGQDLFIKELSVADLGPGITAQLAETWNTAQFPAGNYLARLEVYLNDELVSSSETDFIIDPVPIITGTLEINPLKVMQGENFQAHYTVRNEGNVALQNMPVKVSVNDANQTKIAEQQEPMTLGIDESKTAGFTFGSQGYNLGMYQAVLEAAWDSVDHDLDRKALEIIDMTQPFEKLTGTIQATPNPVYLGQEESFQYTIRNDTSQMFQNLLIKILVIDPITQEMKITLSETINLSENSTQTGTLKASTSGLVLKTYGAVLKVETTGQDPRKLAETVFKVIASQDLEADKTLVDETRLLVWVNDNCPSSCRPKEHGALKDGLYSEASCNTGLQKEISISKFLQSQDKLYCDPKPCKECLDLNLLKLVLDQVADHYKIVFSPCAFGEEMRNPFYTDILILGDHQPLPDHMAAELREKVYSGTGLISSQWLKHGCSADYDDVFGITYKGVLSDSDPLIETVQSPVTTPGTFKTIGKAHKIQTDPDTLIAGWIKTNSKRKNWDYRDKIMCPPPDPQGPYAALVLHDYGQGRAIYQTFDLGRSLNETNREWVRALLENSLNYVHKAHTSNEFAPYELAAIRLSLKSMGSALIARINESFPKELSLYDPITKQWIDESPWVFDTSLDVNGEKEIPFYYLTPDKAGTFQTQTDISMLLNDEPVPVKQLQLDLAVTRDLDLILDEAINNLMALSLSHHDRAAVKNALAALNKVKEKTVRTRSDVDGIVKELLKAVDYLRSVKSGDMSIYRLELDRLIRSYAALYYLFVPPGEYLQGSLEAVPNPVKTNKEVNFHVVVINDGNEAFRDLKLKVKIMDPNTGQVIKTLEKALIMEGNSSQELDLKTVLKSFKAKTYKVQLKAYSGLLPEPKVLAEVNLKVTAH